jgi:TolB protein
MLELFTFNVETGEKISIAHSRFLANEYNLKEHLPWCNAFTKAFTGRPGILGTRIVYSRRSHNPKAAKEIWMVGLDGFHEKQLTDNGSINILPSWESNGQNVAYTSYREGNPNLYLGEQIFSGRPNMNTSADWNPRGNLVAVTLGKDGNSEIYLLDATSGRIVRRLTSHHAIDSSPSWSPDGKWISFVSDRMGSPQVYIMDAYGKNVRRITTQHGYCTSPDWSPVGNLIAFNAMMEGGRFDLFLIDPATGTESRITRGAGSNEDPSWSPDGRYLVFSSTRRSHRSKKQRHLYIIGAQGGKAHRLTHGNVQYFTPAWSPF